MNRYEARDKARQTPNRYAQREQDRAVSQAPEEPPHYSLFDAVTGGLASLPHSASDFAGNVVRTGVRVVQDPIHTIPKGVNLALSLPGALAEAVGGSAVNALTPDVRGMVVGSNPELQKMSATAAAAKHGAKAALVGPYLDPHTGKLSYDALKRTIHDDPLRVAVDASTALGGAGAVARGLATGVVGPVLGKLGGVAAKPLTEASVLLNPLHPENALMRGAGAVANKVAGKPVHLNPVYRAGDAVRGVVNALNPNAERIKMAVGDQYPQVLNALNQAKPLVLGAEPSALDALAGTSAAHLAAIVKKAEGTASDQSTAAKMAQNAAALAVPRAFGGDVPSSVLIPALKTETKGKYDAAHKIVNTANEDFQKIKNRPSMQDALEAGLTAAAERGRVFQIGEYKPQQFKMVGENVTDPYLVRKNPYHFEYNPDPTSVNRRAWYHGTGHGELTPADIDPRATKSESLFGRGLYLTDNPEIAQGYSMAARNRHANPTVYEAGVNVGRVLDLDNHLPPEAVQVFSRVAHSVSPELGAKVDTLVTKGGNGQTLYKAIRQHFDPHGNNVEPPPGAHAPRGGAAPEPRGAAVEAPPRREYANHFDTINTALHDIGYDAVTHTGGIKGGPKHQVLIMLDPNGHLGITQGGQLPRFQPMETVVSEQPMKPVLVPPKHEAYTGENLHRVRKALQDIVYKQGAAGDAAKSADTMSTLDAFTKWFEEQNDLYKQARENHALKSSVIDRKLVGEAFERALKGPLGNDETLKLRANTLASMMDKGELPNHNVSRVTRNNRLVNFQNALTPEEYQALQGLVDHFARSQQGLDLAARGSQALGEAGTKSLTIPGNGMHQTAINAVIRLLTGQMSKEYAGKIITKKGLTEEIGNALRREAKLNRTSNALKAGGKAAIKYPALYNALGSDDNRNALNQ